MGNFGYVPLIIFWAIIGRKKTSYLCENQNFENPYWINTMNFLTTLKADWHDELNNLFCVLMANELQCFHPNQFTTFLMAIDHNFIFRMGTLP